MVLTFNRLRYVKCPRYVNYPRYVNCPRDLNRLKIEPDAIHIASGSFLIGICNIVSIEMTCTLII